MSMLQKNNDSIKRNKEYKPKNKALLPKPTSKNITSVYYLRKTLGYSLLQFPHR